ncbi:MAG: hypothetical protein ABWY18_19250 [Tardiphaga sp.]
MASWQEERDRLIAQTRDFVEQVAAASPRAALPATSPVVRKTVDSPIEFQPALRERIPDGRPVPDGRDAPIVRAGQLPQNEPTSLRADISNRVATFRQKQSALAHDREIYYEEMQAQIRKALGNDSGPHRL